MPSAIPPFGLLRRAARLILTAVGAAPSLVLAQAVRPAPAELGRPAEPVLLAAFEVSAAGDDGYKAANAISGTSFNTALLDLPRPIEVITAEFIEDIGAREIGEALRYSGSMSDNGTATPEDVTGNNFYNRGFQSFTSYRNGYRSYGVADTLFIDRVEIIKGPSSTFSGTIEPGGTLNMITRRPGPNPSGHVRLRYGSYASRRAELLYSTPVDAGKKLRILIGSAYEDYGSQYDFAGRERKVYGGNIQYAFTPRTRLSFDFQWQSTRGTQAIPPIYFTSTTGYYVKDIPRGFNRAGPESTSSIIQSQGSLELNHQLSPHWVVRAGGYFRGQRQGRNTMAGSQALVVNAVTRARTVARIPTVQFTGNDNYIAQASILGDHAYGAITHKVFLGFEYLGVVDSRSQQFRRPTNPPNINVDSATRADHALGPWSAYTTRFADTILDSGQRGYTVSNIVQLLGNRLLLMQGYRYGQFFQNSENRLARTATSSSQGADVGSYGVSYRVAPRMTVFASHAESFSPQTATDYAGRLFAPVTGKGWDLGPKFDLIEGRLSGTLVAFAIERSNVLQPDPEHPGFNTASGLDRSRGVEFTLNARFVRAWQVVLSYANLDVKTIKDPTRPANVGLSPPNVARNQANLWNRYAFSSGPLQGLGIGVGVIHVGERRGNNNLANLPQFRSPAYTKADANVTYARKLFGRSVTFSLAVQNLTNVDYYASFSALSEPRSATASVMTRF
jgi:iron complex outermembrane receptor protein